MRFCLTIDIDWAPDFVIEWMLERVKSAGASATWFATHDSPVIRKIAADVTQEVGLHPNFFSGSTQGRTMEEIMSGLISAYPDARGVRAHALFDSTRHQRYYAKRGISYVSNILIWNSVSQPFFQPWTGLWQIPISWEDDVACAYTEDISSVMPKRRRGPLWVIVFHPLYCYLNERGKMRSYFKVKERCKNIRKASAGYLDSARLKGKGLVNALDSVLKESGTHAFPTLGAVCGELAKKSGLPRRGSRCRPLSGAR